MTKKCQSKGASNSIHISHRTSNTVGYRTSAILVVIITVAQQFQASSSLAPKSILTTDSHQDGCNAISSAGFLLPTKSNTIQLGQTSAELADARLADALSRIGPDLRQLRDFSNADDALNVDVDLAKRAWKLMRAHTQASISGRLRHVAPILLDTLVSAKVSSKCIQAVERTLESAKSLESWAIQRKFPTPRPPNPRKAKARYR